MRQRELFNTPEERSIEIIKAHKPIEGYWLAFSGGKDSVVLYDLAVKSGVKFDAHYNNTTCDPPDLIYFIREYYPDVVWEHPEKSIWAAIPVRGFPLRQQRWCCQEYKERGGGGRFVLTGIRAQESNQRKTRGMVETCYRDKTKIFVHPIMSWSEDQVWEYIKENDLPYCRLYDEGWRRIGCVICPFNNRIKEDLDRYPGYMRLLKRAFNELYVNIEHRPSSEKFSSGEQMLNWWLDRTRHYKSDDDETLPLFI